MTESELAAIEDGLEGSTPGPWVVSDEHIAGWAAAVRSGKRALAFIPGVNGRRDADFIAASPEHIKALVAEVRLLQRVVMADKLPIDHPDVAALVKRERARVVALVRGFDDWVDCRCEECIADANAHAFDGDRSLKRLADVVAGEDVTDA